MNIFLKETNYELLSIGNCHNEQFLVNNTNIKKTFYYFRCANMGSTEKAKKIFFINYLFGEIKWYMFKQPMETLF